MKPLAVINKAINYLKWTRNKFKLRSGEVKIAEILELNLNKQSFGCQREEDKFIIWKHIVKWKKYTEINVNEEALLFEGFGKKKKRKKIETLFNCIKKLNIMKNMKKGKIYNLFTESNLEHIIRKIVRKKDSNLSYVEKEENIDLEKLFMNWRTRKKKSPDKIVNV
jgi:hypothetical protein